MKSCRQRLFLIAFVCGFGSVALLVGRMRSQEPSVISSDVREESLNRFLWYHEGGGFRAEPTELRYLNAFVDLNRDGRDEAIVYYASRCGSGGCGLLILTPEGSSYRLELSRWGGGRFACV